VIVSQATAAMPRRAARHDSPATRGRGARGRRTSIGWNIMRIRDELRHVADGRSHEGHGEVEPEVRSEVRCDWCADPCALVRSAELSRGEWQYREIPAGL